MDTPGKRLKAVTKYYGLTQYALAQRIGVSKGYISQIVNSGSPITTNIIEGLIKSFARLNIHWLLTGEGEMLFDGEKEKTPPDTGLLTGVMEPPAGYERMRSLRVDELPEIILSLQAEVEELRERVKRLEEKLEEGEGKGV